MDNNSVRANLNNYVPGETSGDHDHKDPRFIFVLEPGTLESTDPSGAATDRTFERDACLYAAPARHNVRNIGSTVATLLEVEIKTAHGPRESSVPCVEMDLSQENDGAKPGSPSGGSSKIVRRTVLLRESDLVVTRVELAEGGRERPAHGRGNRLVYVLIGGTLDSKMPSGKRVVATQGSAVWIAGSAPLKAQDNGDLVLLEIEPLAGAKP